MTVNRVPPESGSPFQDQAEELADEALRTLSDGRATVLALVAIYLVLADIRNDQATAARALRRAA